VGCLLPIFMTITSTQKQACVDFLDNTSPHTAANLRRLDMGDYHPSWQYKVAASRLHTTLGVLAGGLSLFISLLIPDRGRAEKVSHHLSSRSSGWSEPMANYSQRCSLKRKSKFGFEVVSNPHYGRDGGRLINLRMVPGWL
jgi:hypothetical protein